MAEHTDTWDDWSQEDLLKHILKPILFKPNVTFEGKTYVADEVETKDYKYYSKSWHDKYGPKITVSDRKVYVIDHATLSCKPLARFQRWPAAPRTISFRGVTTKISYGPLRAIIDRIPREDLPLLIGSQGPIVDSLIEHRLKKGT